MIVPYYETTTNVTEHRKVAFKAAPPSIDVWDAPRLSLDVCGGLRWGSIPDVDSIILDCISKQSQWQQSMTSEYVVISSNQTEYKQRPCVVRYGLQYCGYSGRRYWY